MRRAFWQKILFLLTLAVSPFAAADDASVTLDTRPNVTQSFLLRTPLKKPVASVILFPGGDGNIKLDGAKIGWLKNNFLIRIRHLLVQQGFQVALVDSPSDKKYVDGMESGFRMSPEHATDIQAVIAHLKKQADVPVWLIGTSRGTESAAYVGLHSQDKIAGIVLTSTIVYSNKKGKSVTTLDLESVRVPVLIVAHRNDGCEHTPASGAERIKKALTQSPKVEIVYFEGGDPPRSSACDALSQHGFLGIEQQVVDAIAAFIKAPAK